MLLGGDSGKEASVLLGGDSGKEASAPLPCCSSAPEPVPTLSGWATLELSR